MSCRASGIPWKLWPPWNFTIDQFKSLQVELAVTDVIKYISDDEKVNNETKEVITEKLKTAKLWVMFSDDILILTKIEVSYNKLDLNGLESLWTIFFQLFIVKN